MCIGVNILGLGTLIVIVCDGNKGYRSVLIFVVVVVGCTVGDGRCHLYQWWAIDGWHLPEVRSPGPGYLFLLLLLLERF